ncbi:hypothetical protein DEJ01_12085 [Curtobacterium sp. MCLR17_040]|nr:hypothetical protein DEJ01_12085 [Curtobacterium sp. MCLR17_040]
MVTTATNGYREVFVDESKVKDYLLVAVCLERSSTRAARSALTGLVLRGQSRLHMRKESDARRRLILSTIASLPVEVTVFRAVKDGRSDTARRAACLRRLVAATAVSPRVSVCFERDETLIRKDRQWIVEATRDSGGARLVHRHETAAHEPLLALPDAVGWAWAKGGDWRRRCPPEINVIDV